MSATFGTLIRPKSGRAPFTSFSVNQPRCERLAHCRTAKIKSRDPVGGQRNFRGRIVGIDNDQVIFDDQTSGRVRVPFDGIVKANLEIDVEREFRLAKEREELDRHLLKNKRR